MTSLGIIWLCLSLTNVVGVRPVGAGLVCAKERGNGGVLRCKDFRTVWRLLRRPACSKAVGVLLYLLLVLLPLPPDATRILAKTPRLVALHGNQPVGDVELVAFPKLFFCDGSSATSGPSLDSGHSLSLYLMLDCRPSLVAQLQKKRI
eukprot:GHVT01076728.1.p1 GENE.GHVT01076728.1~~GHVT01076728.1.p1  ORF type:complete len:148 (-),score=25.32 GHVT01076728.1:441-884(-)